MNSIPFPQARASVALTLQSSPPAAFGRSVFGDRDDRGQGSLVESFRVHPP